LVQSTPNFTEVIFYANLINRKKAGLKVKGKWELVHPNTFMDKQSFLLYGRHLQNIRQATTYLFKTTFTQTKSDCDVINTSYNQ